MGGTYRKVWFILRKGVGCSLAANNLGRLGVELGIMMSTIIEKCLSHLSSPFGLIPKSHALFLTLVGFSEQEEEESKRKKKQLPFAFRQWGLE